MATQYPPFAIWTDDDHSSAVLITTTLCMLYWFIPGIAQQVTSVANDVRFPWSELSFTLSLATGVIQSALVLAAAHYGLGKSESSLRANQTEQAKRLYYLSNLFYVLVLGLIKCSVASFIANLTVHKRGSLRHASRQHIIVLCAILGLVVAWTITSIIILALPCGSQAACIGTMTRWRGIFAGDAVTDIAIALFAANVIWRTQAAFRARLMWYLPFCFRICVPICAGLRLTTINQYKLTHTPLFSLWLFVVLSQLQILLSLLGSTIHTLSKTMRDLATNYGATSDSPANSRARTGGSFAMKDLRYFNHNGSSQASGGGKRFAPFSGNAFQNNAAVRRGDTDGDNDSQEGIIRRDDVEVSYANADE